MDFTAPAKLNLFLKVLGKRQDGYHDIETIFERISLSDTISVDKATGPTVITCDDAAIPVGESSLTGMAVSRFKKAYPGAGDFRIHIRKRIPVGAGLGGGSSDTATVIKALNAISGSPLGEDVLLRIGSSLGADVPFFLKDIQFGYGTEKGDAVKTIKTELKFSHILINPGIHISTEMIYKRYNIGFGLTNTCQVDKMVSAFLSKGAENELVKNLHNDLQIIVLRDFPVVKKALTILEEAGARGVLMSGSGPTVFGIFDPDAVEGSFDSIKSRINSDKAWKAFLAHTY